METFRYNSKKLMSTLMRSAATALLVLFASTLLHASEPEQKVPSTITNVTVFLNQAQVTRAAKTNLQPGITHLIFDHISPYINLNSLQVKTDENVLLLSVSQRNNFLQSNDKPKHITELEDTLDVLNQLLQSARIKKEALELEKEVMAANKHIGGENSGVKVEDLEDALTLFRKRSQEIGEELFKLELTTQKLTSIQTKFKAQLDEYLTTQSGFVELVISVKSLTNATNARIEFNYLVSNTSWTPFYDIRVKDTKSKLQLITKANIYQQTGEDWKNVILKLSTANPNESGNKPELQPLHLGFQNPYLVSGAGYVPSTPNIRGARADGTAYYIDGVRVQGESNDKPQMKTSAGIASSQQTQSNIEFNVSSAYSIPSDNNPHQVDLTVSELEASYAYGTVPKADKDAFVTAKVSGNDLVNQINGEANVYFDGTFTGKSYINGTTSDSILLTLGRDKRIQIQRTQLKDFSSKTFTGGSKKEMSTWEISIRNTRKEAITIVVEDQIPVSNDKDIEVKVLNLGNASYDETTGKLTWTITIEPEKTQLLKFSFEVKYPKEKIINPY